MELTNQNQGYFVWQKLNSLFKKEGYDRVLTFEFPIREAAIFDAGIQYLNKAGVISLSNKRAEKGNCFYNVIPRRSFNNFPSILSETVTMKESAPITRKVTKKTNLYLGLKYGLYKKEDPEKGARLNRRELEYMLNLVTGESVKKVLDRNKKEIPSSNRRRTVKVLNKKIRFSFKVEHDLILPGNDYFLNSERFRILEDDSLSTGLIAE